LNFSNTKPKIACRANQNKQTKKDKQRETTEIFFGLFVVWKVEIRIRAIKKAKHGYT
jgi:hypothetical protein